MPGGSLKKSGMESKGICGTVCWAFCWAGAASETSMRQAQAASVFARLLIGFLGVFIGASRLQIEFVAFVTIHFSPSRVYTIRLLAARRCPVLGWDRGRRRADMTAVKR